MPKKSLLWLVVALVVLAIIYFGFIQKKDTTTSDSTNTDGTPATTTTQTPDTKTTTTSAPKTTTATTPAIKAGIVKKYGSVLEAVNSSASVRCSNPTGTVTTTHWIARGKVRRDSVTVSGTNYIVSTPSALFAWNKGSTKETDYYGNVAIMERQNLMNTSLVGVSCVTANIPDTTFARP